MNLFKKMDNEKLPQEVQFFFIAVATLQQGEYEKSLKLFNELIDKYVDLSNPSVQVPSYYHNRSLAKSHLGNIDGAIEDLNISINISETNESYFELFRLYHHKGEPQNGLKYLIKAYELGNKKAEEILRENTNYFKR